MEDRIKALEEKLESIVSKKYYETYTGTGRGNLFFLEQLIPLLDWYRKNSYKLDWYNPENYHSRIRDIEDKLKITPYYQYKKKWYQYLKFWTWFKRKQVTTYIPYKEFSEKLCDCPNENWMDEYYQGIFK